MSEKTDKQFILRHYIKPTKKNWFVLDLTLMIRWLTFYRDTPSENILVATSDLFKFFDYKHKRLNFIAIDESETRSADDGNRSRNTERRKMNVWS